MEQSAKSTREIMPLSELQQIIEEDLAGFINYRKGWSTTEKLAEINQAICASAQTLLLIKDFQFREAKEEETEPDPAAETRDRAEIVDTLKKQLERLSRASWTCEGNNELISHLPALTQAMIEISRFLLNNNQ